MIIRHFIDCRSGRMALACGLLAAITQPSLGVLAQSNSLNTTLSSPPQSQVDATATPQAQPPQQGPSSGIFCRLRNGIPTTVSLTRRGEVPIIKWTSGEFDASGWTPEKRCELVSQRFETFRASGQLQYLTTGRVAGQPVICAVVSDSSPCTPADVLYTLKKGQDPSATLRRLLNVRRGVTGVMQETGTRVYLNFNQFIDERLAAPGRSSRSQGSAVGTSSGAAW